MKDFQILIVEDDPAVLTLTRDLLMKEEYKVMAVSEGKDGWGALQWEKFDLLVLDLGLPDMDGLELCAQIKRDPLRRDLPVFILTARGSTEDIVKGLEAGAEDYLPKPFNEREFLARVQAILRRREPLKAKDDVVSVGKIKLSPSSHQAWAGEKPVALTLREFDILRVFLSNPGKALTREDIVKMAWGPATAIVPKVVDVHVGHIRTKLGTEGKHVETVPQVGYKLVIPKK
jgi:DNA-binding response OmpR family regulator